MPTPIDRHRLSSALMAGLFLFAASAWAQTITTVAGNGSWQASGNGGPALQAGLAGVSSIARDPAGNLYLVEPDTYRIRRIGTDGVISNFAGNGQPVFASDTETSVGDGGQATAAAISPGAVATDAAGNVYFTDLRHHRVRKVTPAGIISTIAGRGEFGYTGDGGAATLARLADLRGIAVDGAGNVYISVGQAIRKITPGGTISRFAGSLIDYAFAGDGGPATSAFLHNPAGLAVDAAGNVFVADSGNGRVRRIGTNGVITTVMGTRNSTATDPYGWPWDHYAKQLRLDVVTDVAVDSNGYVYAAAGGTWIRKVSPEGWTANAGGFRCPDDSCGVSAIPAMMPDGGDVFQAWLSGATSIEIEPGDSLLVATDHARLRRISPTGPAQPPVAADVLKPYATYPVAGSPSGLGVGDFDGDGRKDVVLVTTGGTVPQADDFQVLLFRQQPDGSLAAPVKAGYPNPIDNWRAGVVLTDLNHDGRQDIVIGRSGGLTIFLGNAGGALAAQQLEAPFMSASYGYSLFTTDVDDDGHPDIVTNASHLNQMAGGLWTFRGVGDGTLQAGAFTSYYAVFGTDSVGKPLVADFDGDGDEDLLAGGNGRMNLLLHQGNGQYVLGQTLPGFGAVKAAGDVDDDGRQDYIEFNDVSLLVVRQDANRRFDAPSRMRVERMGDAAELRDLNKDGRRDILQVEMGWGVSYYQRNATGYEVVRKYPLPFANRATGLAVTAFDGDACDDVLIATETGSAGLIILRGQNCSAPSARRDTDGDGRDELAWSQPGGTMELWPGGERSQAVGVRPRTGWGLAAMADFTGDGRAELLWRHCVGGALMQTQGTSAVASATQPGPGRDWRLVATADFDGDRRADLLWQHASGVTERWSAGSAQGRQRGPRLPAGWSVVASGDFDGDGRADLFLRHAPTGANQIWRAGGSAGAQRVTAITDRQWEVVASGDSDGDGRADLFWRHRRDGRNALWPAADYARRRTLPTLADPAWRVVAMDDGDGDRRADVTWQHGSGLGLVWKRADAALATRADAVPRGARPAVGADACRAGAAASSSLRQAALPQARGRAD